MIKKTIILVLVFLIVINTIYWISLIYQLGRLGGINLYFLDSYFLDGLLRYSGEGGNYAVKNIIDILTITDAVLIAISFMIILLYKKDKTLRGKKNEKDI